MIDMLPVSIVGLDCYINSLLTVVNWKLGEYHMSFWDSWCFRYVPSVSLGESVEYPMSYVLSNLQYYYNYVFENLEDVDNEKVLLKIIEILDCNMPVVVCIDMYFCNWTENYKKDHAEHIVVINGYKNSKFSIIDTMPVQTGIEIEFSELHDGIIWAKKVDFHINSFEYITVEKFLKYTMVRIENNKEFEQFEKFVIEISTEKLSKDLQCKGYIWSIPILNNLRRLYGNRKQFLLILEKVESSQATEKFLVEKVRTIYQEVIKQWGVIVNLLYKYRTVGKIGKNNDIKERFERLLLLERTVYAEIGDLLLKNDTEGIKETKTLLHKIIFQNNFQSHFSGNEDFEYFSELPQELVVGSKTIKFEFIENQNNCISCSGQQQVIDNFQVIKLHFIGYSIWGNQIGNVKLTFSDCENIFELRLSDWCLGENFCEKILWEGKFIKKNENGEVCHAYIYDAELVLPSNKKLTKIALPENDKMLLFCVYAERELTTNSLEKD